MGGILPFIAVMMDATGSTLEKVVLSVKGLLPKTYMSAAYIVLFLTDLAFFLWLDLELPTYLTRTGFYFALVVGIGLLGNFLYYRAIKSDDLTQVTQFSLLYNIPLIILAYLFFPEQSSATVAVLAVIAALTVIWSQWEGGFHIKRSTMAFFLFTLVGIPFGSVLQTLIMEEWNPVQLAISSDALIALALLPIFLAARRKGRLPLSAAGRLVASQVLIAVSFMAYLWSYATLGLLYTSLIMMLQPLMVYLFSVKFLGEKFETKKTIAFGVVLLCITAATAAG
jgi:drug/metabolite transporter (DMT)-like permease